MPNGRNSTLEFVYYWPTDCTICLKFWIATLFRVVWLIFEPHIILTVVSSWILQKTGLRLLLCILLICSQGKLLKLAYFAFFLIIGLLGMEPLFCRLCGPKSCSGWTQDCYTTVCNDKEGMEIKCFHFTLNFSML